MCLIIDFNKWFCDFDYWLDEEWEKKIVSHCFRHGFMIHSPMVGYHIMQRVFGRFENKTGCVSVNVNQSTR